MVHLLGFHEQTVERLTTLTERLDHLADLVCGGDLRRIPDAGRHGVRRGGRERSGVAERRRKDDRVDDLLQRVCLDQHVLDIALETDVIARLELWLREDAKLGEQRARLACEELVERFRRPAQIRQAALFGLLHPVV